MKKYLIRAGILLLLLTGCNKMKTIEKERVDFAEENEFWEIDLKYFLFSSEDLKTNESCAELNSAIEKLVFDLQEKLKSDVAEMFRYFEKEEIERPAWKGQMYLKDSVFMTSNHYISIRYLVYTFTGGAHGMTNFHALNYDMKKRRLLTNDEIILKTGEQKVNQKLKEHFVNRENCFNEVPTLDKVSVINITPENILFTYESYILGPYVCGYNETLIPRSELKETLVIQ